MSNLLSVARRGTRSGPNPWPQITLDQLPYWFGEFGYAGLGYGPAMIQTLQQNRETIAADFLGFINGAYKTNGAIFACMLCRMMLFSEARFQFRRMNNGRPGKLFGTQDLDLLEHPWPNATTGDLLSRAINDVDLSGNFYAIRAPLQNRKGVKLARLRPDWVTIIKGSTNDASLDASWDPSAELIGYVYEPGGPGSGLDPKFYTADEVMHFAPIIDPIASYRGMSWVQPLLAEVMADRAMTTHRVMFFENGASPNLVVSMETGKMDRRTFQDWVDAFEAEHSGATNSAKTLYLGNGASAQVVGSTLKDLDYSAVTNLTESRIAAAAGIPPMVIGFMAGAETSTLANFQQATRLAADKTLRPLWRNFCSSMETLIPPPGGSQLWYDDRDIPFLQDDESDAADVLLTKSTAMRLLVDAGYEPESVVSAIESNDLSLLQHSGLYSVQLHPPGTDPPLMVGNPNGGQGGDQAQGTPPPPASGGNQNGQSAGKRAMLAGVGNVQELAQALLAAKANGT